MATLTFARSITTFVEKTGVRADQVLRKLGLDAFQGVLLKSPVDTGRFRASWRITINRVDLSTIPPPDAPTMSVAEAKDAYRVLLAGAQSAQQAAAVIEVGKAVFGDSINITNNLPYAEKLEDGWSGQAPQGVLKLTFQEIVSEFDAVVRKVVGEIP